MISNRILLGIIFTLFLLQFYHCNTKEVKVKAPCDCKGDTIQDYVFDVSSDLSLTDSIFLIRYKKDSEFNTLIDSNKCEIFIKQYNKGSTRWDLSIRDSINVNYNYLFIIPQAKDTDFYYVSQIELFYTTNVMLIIN